MRLRNRRQRIKTGPLTHCPTKAHGSAFRGSYERYANGRRIYSVPHGIVWQESDKRACDAQ